MDLRAQIKWNPRQVFAIVSHSYLSSELTTVTERVPSVQSVLDTFSPRRGFFLIASDLLEGRDSPSRGWNCAEYIAASFDVPLGACWFRWDFQTANWRVADHRSPTFRS